MSAQLTRCFCILTTCLILASLAACGDDGPAQTVDEPETEPDDWSIEAMFPGKGGYEFDGCVYSSPMHFEGDDAAFIVALGARGTLAGFDPETGEEQWSLELPAPDGEGVLSIAQPAFIDDHRIVVAYHTVPEGLDRIDANARRLSHQVTVVDLAARAVDDSFGTIVLEAEVDANEEGETLSFRADHALARPDVKIGRLDGDQFGKAYVTSGNTRDIQPWHGWAFEIDLDAWHNQGKEMATSATLVTTPEPDSNCGPENSSGSRKRLCGGGLWAPSGPLVLDQPDGYEVVLAPGNGQLDLARSDYANTLMRTGPGLDFDPACDAQACADFDPDEPSLACVESCENLWIPRLTGQDDQAPDPWDGRCDGLSLFECWQKLDYIGGSTPTYVEIGDFKTLSYPTKDGHLYLIDQTHFGTQFDRIKLVDQCGAEGDRCRWDWAGMTVTQPLVVEHNGQPVLMVPTFMSDKTHPAGVVAVTIEETESGPRYQRLWEYPSFDTAAAVERFRRHPSRMAMAPWGDEDRELAWLVEVSGSSDRGGRLIALDPTDGSAVFETSLSGKGYRYTVPLIVEDRIYVSSCASDFGPGHIEGFQLTKEVAD